MTVAYTYKNRLETVAEAITELRWSEMQELAGYIASIEITDEDDVTPAFWAAILNDWASGKISEYSAKCQGEAK